MLTGLFNNTCDVYSLTTTQNAMGAQKRTYSLRINDLKVAFTMKKTSNETEVFDKTTSAYIFIFYCEYNSTNAAITESDKIVYDGRDFEVKRVYNASGRSNHLEITAEELR